MQDDSNIANLIQKRFMDNKNKYDYPVIFVVGNSRSGTTMMARILGNHPEVLRLQELHFFEELWSAKDKDKILSGSDAAALAARLLCAHRDDYIHIGKEGRYHAAAEEIVGEIHTHYLTSSQVFKSFLFYEAYRNGKKIPCENTPRNVFYIGDILSLYPDAKIINMIRDPRDVLLSQKKKWRMRLSIKRLIPIKEVIRLKINYHPITISKLWNSSIAAADKFAGDSKVLSLYYEDLIAEPEKSVKEICDFVNISFNPEMLNIPYAGSSIEKDNLELKGIRRDRIGGWQKGGLNSAEIYLCQKITSALMKKNGYTTLSVRPNPLMLIYYFLSFPIKIFMALCLNLKRMRNVSETIKRRLS